MSEVYDDVRLYLPKYLSASDQNRLLSELGSFPNNLDKRFYTIALKDQSFLFQGDGFCDVVMPDIERKEFRSVKGFLISNTCDSSTENTRLYKAFLTFAPIMDLQKYEIGLLRRYERERVVSHTNSIRQQGVSTFVYLPPDGIRTEEYFVRLDCAFSMPLTKELETELIKNKIFTLSDYGFYMLLFKLSIHLTRVQEAVARNPY